MKARIPKIYTISDLIKRSDSLSSVTVTYPDRSEPVPVRPNHEASLITSLPYRIKMAILVFVGRLDTIDWED